MKEHKKGEKKIFIRIPQTRYSIKLNFILAAGLILVLAGVFLLVKMSPSATKTFALFPAIILLLGSLFLFFSLAFIQNSFFLYVGIYLFLSGLLTILTNTHVIPLTMHELWPVLVIALGVSLFPAGFYKMKRLRSVYLFPAIVLMLLGVFFLMFSLHIFKTSLSQFVAKWWPVFMILAGLIVVIVFIWQQSHRKDFPYMKDDSLSEDDD